MSIKISGEITLLYLRMSPETQPRWVDVCGWMQAWWRDSQLSASYGTHIYMYKNHSISGITAVHVHTPPAHTFPVHLCPNTHTRHLSVGTHFCDALLGSTLPQAAKSMKPITHLFFLFNNPKCIFDPDIFSSSLLSLPASLKCPPQHPLSLSGTERPEASLVPPKGRAEGKDFPL